MSEGNVTWCALKAVMSLTFPCRGEGEGTSSFIMMSSHDLWWHQCFWPDLGYISCQAYLALVAMVMVVVASKMIATVVLALEVYTYR